jgi:hypothetical protein
MKKVLLVLAVITVLSVVMSSCGSSHSCPAYGKVAPKSAEKAC